MESEAEFVTLLMRKDQKAFARLFDRYAPALYGFILKFVPQKRLATEILEESFVHIGLNIHLYKASGTKLFSWMVSVVVKQCQKTSYLPNRVFLASLSTRPPLPVDTQIKFNHR